MTATARRRTLVVADGACAAPDLCASVRALAGDGAIEALVIAPAHDTAAHEWYVDEDAARAEATDRLHAWAACLSNDGIRAAIGVSDPDPVLAIADALHEFAADDIVVVTGPQRPSSWLRPNVADRVRRRFDLPIEHVVVPTAPTVHELIREGP